MAVDILGSAIAAAAVVVSYYLYKSSMRVNIMQKELDIVITPLLGKHVYLTEFKELYGSLFVSNENLIDNELRYYMKNDHVATATLYVVYKYNYLSKSLGYYYNKKIIKEHEKEFNTRKNRIQVLLLLYWIPYPLMLISNIILLELLGLEPSSTNSILFTMAYNVVFLAVYHTIVKI